MGGTQGSFEDFPGVFARQLLVKFDLFGYLVASESLAQERVNIRFEQDGTGAQFDRRRQGLALNGRHGLREGSFHPRFLPLD